MASPTSNHPHVGGQASTPVVLVHYHEIGLKGRNRSSFERQLICNIEFLCQGLPIERVSKISGRVLVTIDRAALGQGREGSACATDDGSFVPGGLRHREVEQVFRQLQRIPGVARVSLGWRTDRELPAIEQLAFDVLSDCEPFSAFKVDAHRSNTDFAIRSMELNRIVGAYLCERFPQKHVRMEEPDATVRIEIIQGSCYIYARSQPGVGGLPVGSAGTFVSLLSTGIDSPVALWRLVHRGGVAVALHFSGAPQTDDSSEYLVRDLCDQLAFAGGIRSLRIARIGAYQKRIAETVPSKLRVVFFRRLMFAVANELARREGALAIATGESLGQVASQTMDNIRAVDEVAAFPVFRPLIGSDKQEIIALAQKLGTYELSVQPCSDCCTLFLPKSPETHAKLDEVHELASRMDFAAWALEICDDLQKIEGHSNCR